MKWVGNVIFWKSVNVNSLLWQRTCKLVQFLSLRPSFSQGMSFKLSEPDILRLYKRNSMTLIYKYFHLSLWKWKGCSSPTRTSSYFPMRLGLANHPRFFEPTHSPHQVCVLKCLSASAVQGETPTPAICSEPSDPDWAVQTDGPTGKVPRHWQDQLLDLGCSLWERRIF